MIIFALSYSTLQSQNTYIMYSNITKIPISYKFLYTLKYCIENSELKVIKFLRQFCGNYVIILVNYRLKIYK